MSRGKKAVIVAGLLILAVCAALPFQHRTAQQTESADPSAGKNPQADEQFVAPLHAPLQSNRPLADVSKIDDVAQDAKKENPQATIPKLGGDNPIDETPRPSLAPPPDLPTRYRAPLYVKPLESVPFQKKPVPFRVELIPDKSADDPATTEETPRTNKKEEEKLPAAPRKHKIVDGDTLQQLAKKYLGSRDRYLEIYEANRDLLPSPQTLPIGAEIAIPSRD